MIAKTADKKIVSRILHFTKQIKEQKGKSHASDQKRSPKQKGVSNTGASRYVFQVRNMGFPRSPR